MRSPLKDDQTTRPETRRPTVLLEIRFLRQPAHPGSTGPSRCRSTLSSSGRRDERPRTNTESRAECGLPADGNTDSKNTPCLANKNLSPELCPPGRIERLGPGSRQPYAVEKRSCGPLMRARTLGSGANCCPAETSRGLCPRTAWRGGRISVATPLGIRLQAPDPMGSQTTWIGEEPPAGHPAKDTVRMGNQPLRGRTDLRIRPLDAHPQTPDRMGRPTTWIGQKSLRIHVTFRNPPANSNDHSHVRLGHSYKDQEWCEAPTLGCGPVGRLSPEGAGLSGTAGISRGLNRADCCGCRD